MNWDIKETGTFKCTAPVIFEIIVFLLFCENNDRNSGCLNNLFKGTHY